MTLQQDEFREIPDEPEVGTQLTKASSSEVIEYPLPRPSLAMIQHTKEDLATLQQLVTEVLTPQYDWGRIPGVPAPCLFDPGASKIFAAFNVYPGERKILKMEDDQTHIVICVEVPIIDRKTGKIVATGVGAASTLETKHKYRWIEDPKSWGLDDFTIASLKTKQEGDRTLYRVPNLEYSELLNTILKMASKRCLGATTPLLIKTNRSIARTHLSHMFSIYRKHNGPIQVVGPDGTWQNVVAMTRQVRTDAVRIDLADGFWFRAAPEHRFPTTAGLKTVSELKIGDTFIISKKVPLSTAEGPIDLEYGWLIGMFLAEGHYLSDLEGLRFTLNSDEVPYMDKIRNIVRQLGARVAISPRKDSHTTDVNVYGKALVGLMQQFVEGDNCYTKHLSRWCWEQSLPFLDNILQGYLDGDGSDSHRHATEIWNLGFTGKNYELASDLRCLCTCLAYTIKIKQGTSYCKGQGYRTFKGWVRKALVRHSRLNAGRIIGIKPYRGKAILYDVETEGNHLFQLVNGLVTHNSEVDAAESLPGVATVLKQLFHPDQHGAGAGVDMWGSFWGEIRRLGVSQETLHTKYGSIKQYVEKSGKPAAEVLKQILDELRKSSPPESRKTGPQGTATQQLWLEARKELEGSNLTAEMVANWWANNKSIVVTIQDFQKEEPAATLPRDAKAALRSFIKAVKDYKVNPTGKPG